MSQQEKSPLWIQSPEETSIRETLIRETFWIDTLGTLEPGGRNKKRYEYVIKPIQNEDVFPFVVPFSKTANIAARIIKNIIKFSNKKKC